MSNLFQSNKFHFPKEEVYNFPVTQTQEQNYNETSLQYCISPITPISEASFCQKSPFLMSFYRKFDKSKKTDNEEPIFAQSVVIQSNQSKFNQDNPLPMTNKTQRIQNAQQQCEVCESHIISLSKKNTEISKSKIYKLLQQFIKLKTENQNIKKTTKNNFSLIKDLMKDCKNDFQKKLTNRVNYELNLKNNIIKDLQQKVEKLSEKVFSLQSQNLDLRHQTQIRDKQLASKYNELLIQYKINQRQLINARQNRKQLQMKLKQKENSLISLQIIKLNLQNNNKELSMKIQELQRSTLMKKNDEIQYDSLSNTHNVNDYSNVKDYIKQTYKIPYSNKSIKQKPSSVTSNPSIYGDYYARNNKYKTRQLYSSSFTRQHFQTIPIQQVIRPEKIVKNDNTFKFEKNQKLNPEKQIRIQNFKVNQKNFFDNFKVENANSETKTIKFIPNQTYQVINKKNIQKVESKQFFSSYIQKSKNDEKSEQQKQMNQIESLQFKIEQLKFTLQDQIRSNKKRY